MKILAEGLVWVLLVAACGRSAPGAPSPSNGTSRLSVAASGCEYSVGRMGFTLGFEAPSLTEQERSLWEDLRVGSLTFEMFAGEKQLTIINTRFQQDVGIDRVAVEVAVRERPTRGELAGALLLIPRDETISAPSLHRLVGHTARGPVGTVEVTETELTPEGVEVVMTMRPLRVVAGLRNQGPRFLALETAGGQTPSSGGSGEPSEDGFTTTHRFPLIDPEGPVTLVLSGWSYAAEDVPFDLVSCST